MRITSSWSGGKDSALAFHLAIQAGYIPVSLINILNSGGLMRAHDLPLFILEQQAKAMGIPIYAEPASWQDYESVFLINLASTQAQQKAEGIVFGDIDLQYHLDWELQLSKKAGMQPVWPLKNKSRLSVAHEIIQSGIKAVIISVQNHLSTEWLGKPFDENTLQQLIERGIDPCGEDGSFHTLVYDAPFFASPIAFELGSTFSANEHYFIEINSPRELQK